ncbi:MAG: hypothetical protein KC910_12550 [Candidatus Eremiobacteraeota bacterium]|nr:hypothetical protein [Candidatus Eremiobacteraeota bacterium]
MKPRGMALAETVAAIFVLASAFVVASVLFHTALQWNSRVYQRQLAVHLAERKLEDIRAWSLQTHGAGSTLFKNGWATQTGGPFTYPEHSGFNLFVDVGLPDPSPTGPSGPFPSPPGPFPGAGFYSPCTQFWGHYPRTKILNDSILQVEVRVEWGNNETFTLVSRLADPIKGFDAPGGIARVTVRQTSGGGNLARNASAEFEADVRDSANNIVDDVMIVWYVEPDSTGNGNLETLDLEGTQARFTNRLDLPPPPAVPDEVIYTGGEVVIGARVRYGGEEAVGWSNALTLAP